MAFSIEKERDLFKKGTIVKYKTKYSHCGYYSEDKRYNVLENETNEKYSGLWVDSIDNICMETVIMYKSSEGIKKGVVLYDEEGYDYTLKINPIEKGITLNIVKIINRSDVIGTLLKDYIFESVN